MPTLEISNLLPPAQVYVMPGQALLPAVQAAGLDWRHQCGGKGRCTTCRLTVTAGAEWLGPLTEPELKFRAEGRLPETDRLSCQATCLPDAPATAYLAGTVPAQGRLPHVAYAAD